MQRISITNPQNIIDGTAKKYYFKLRNTGGPKGDKGDKGDTGSRGPQGEPGNAATVSIGSTTTLPVGYDATVTNSGSIYNAVLNFGIPQGPRGPQGVKGDPGEPGQKGEPGPRGVQGERGTNATVYIGTTTTLNPGSQATVYNSGTDSNAVLNFGIPKGDTGATGATGATGPAGQDGQNFTPTIVDSLPATGDESKLYLTPKAHTTQTVTGNPITASVTEQAGALESFQLDGDTCQQTYTGKNLIGFGTFSLEKSGITCTTSPDGTITLNGTRTGTTTSAIIFGANSPKFNLSGTFTMTIIVLSGSFSGANIGYTATDANGHQQFYQGYGSNGTYNMGTITPTQEKLDATTGINVLVGSGASTFDNLKFKIQVTAGEDHDSDYEPYVGGQASPNPDYPQTIQTVTGEQTVTIEGKNKIKSSTAGSITWSGTTVTYAGNQITINKSGNGGIGANAYTNAVYTPLSANQAYTFSVSYKSGVINAGGSHIWDFYIYAVKADGSTSNTNRWTASIHLDAANLSASATFTPSEDFVGYKLGCYIPGGSSTTTGDVVFNAQLELGSTATTYAPYSKHTYPINLGKNLFDKSSATILDAFIDYGQSSMKISDYAGGRTTYIKCQPNTTYTVSKMLSARFVVATTSVVPANNVTINQYVVANDSTSATITTDGSANYLAVFYYNSSFDTSTPQQILDTLQFEEGSTATPYAPYFTPIELCKLGTYQDYIWKDGDSWKVHKATVSAIIDGSESWAPSGTNTLYAANIYSKIGNSIQSASTGEMYASHFTIADITSSNTLVGASLRVDAAHNVSNLRIRLQDMSGGTAGFRQMLSAEKPSIYARRLTPTDTTITDQTLIAQLEAIRTASLENGTNTITNTAAGSNLAGDMEIGYYGYNPRNRYDKWLWLDINDNYEQIGE